MNILKRMLGLLGAVALVMTMAPSLHAQVAAPKIEHQGVQGGDQAPAIGQEGEIDVAITMDIDSGFQYDVGHSLMTNISNGVSALSSADIDLGTTDFVSQCSTLATGADLVCAGDSPATANSKVKVTLTFDTEALNLADGKQLTADWTTYFAALTRNSVDISNNTHDEDGYKLSIAADLSAATGTFSGTAGSDTHQMTYINTTGQTTFDLSMEADLAGGDAVDSVDIALEGVLTITDI